MGGYQHRAAPLRESHDAQLSTATPQANRYNNRAAQRVLRTARPPARALAMFMAANSYKFVDRWHIPYPIEMVWETLSLPEHYPTWWQGVYLSARPLVDS